MIARRRLKARPQGDVRERAHGSSRAWTGPQLRGPDPGAHAGHRDVQPPRPAAGTAAPRVVGDHRHHTPRLQPGAQLARVMGRIRPQPPHILRHERLCKIPLPIQRPTHPNAPRIQPKPLSNHTSTPKARGYEKASFYKKKEKHLDRNIECIRNSRSALKSRDEWALGVKGQPPRDFEGLRRALWDRRVAGFGGHMRRSAGKWRTEGSPARGRRRDGDRTRRIKEDRTTFGREGDALRRGSRPSCVPRKVGEVLEGAIVRWKEATAETECTYGRNVCAPDEYG